MKDCIIRIEKASYIYRNSHDVDYRTIALDEISLGIKKGQFVAVLGRNGSGKSTLAKLLNVLLVPTEGEVYIAGLKTSIEENIWAIRNRLGMVFQNPDNQIIATSVEEDVAFGPENLGVEPSEIRRRVDEALTMVEMQDYKEHAPHLLSGGQKQRIAIAGILAMRPQCIVLDEATAMLDPSGRKEVMDILHKLNRNEGITIVHITHHMDEAVQADRVVVMDQGKIIMDDSPLAVFADVKKIKSAGLDVPQVTELIHILKEAGIAGNKPVIGLEDACAVIFDWLGSKRKTKTSVRSEHSGNTYNEPAIHARRLKYIYMPDTVYEKAAIKDIDLDIFRGEIVGIIGHTGSGKSTLIQHFNGLLKAAEGTITVNGKDMESKNLKELRRTVGLIFQYPEHQLFEETVYKDIAFGLTRMGIDGDEISDKIAKVINVVNLEPELLEKSPFELSGGQKRRVAIAGVLVMEPSIVVLDEPTAGLDPQGSREIFEFLMELNRKSGTTVIIVSHSMEDIARYTNRVVVMDHGKIEMAGDTRKVFSLGRSLAGLGLDVPQITHLFEKLNHRIPEVNKEILTVQEAVEELMSFS